jgi:hypothetical protein
MLQNPLSEWMHSNWEPLIGYSPEVLTLQEGGLDLCLRAQKTLRGFYKGFGAMRWEYDVEEVAHQI